MRAWDLRFIAENDAVHSLILEDFDHEDLQAQFGTASNCAHIPLIDPNDWERSYLMIKLTADVPEGCGESMPLDRLLLDEELACIARWIVLGDEDVVCE